MAGGRPPKDHIRLCARVPKWFAKAIRHEAIDRDMTIGELVLEAFQIRVHYTNSTDTSEEINDD